MNWKQHIGIGTAAGIIILFMFRNLLDVKLWTIGIIVSVIYSVLPDIDHQNSKLTWTLLTIFTYANVLLLVFKKELIHYSVIGQFVSLLFMKTPHRGITHSLLCNAVFSIGLFMLVNSWVITLAGFISYWSHMIADGIPLKLYGNIR